MSNVLIWFCVTILIRSLISHVHTTRYGYYSIPSWKIYNLHNMQLKNIFTLVLKSLSSYQDSHTLIPQHIFLKNILKRSHNQTKSIENMGIWKCLCTEDYIEVTKMFWRWRWNYWYFWIIITKYILLLWFFRVCVDIRSSYQYFMLVCFALSAFLSVRLLVSIKSKNYILG